MSTPDTTSEHLDTDRPAAPDDLGEAALTLWHAVWDDLDAADLDLDGREVVLLGEACRHLDLSTRLATELAGLDSLMVKGSRGNDRVTPLVTEVDKARRTTSALLRAIFPPDRSAVGRANIAKRWAR